jgi:multicopper oxidase
MIPRRRFLAMAGAGVACPGAWSIGMARARNEVSVPLQLDKTVIDLAGILVETWAYNGVVPGPEIRLKAGETLHVPVLNNLTEDTLLHWHGISLVNAMDGTHLTQTPITARGRFDYRFVVPEAGTHWYHSHSAVQADYGLYGPLIVEPRNEDLSYDKEFVLVLDDWNHGVPIAPVADDAAAGTTNGPRTGFGRYSPSVPGSEDLINTIMFGGRSYPFILVNGCPPEDPTVLDVRKGDRIRLRIINAAADTAYRFAVAGHPLTVTHSDGMPVEPVTVDTIRIGMAERYDVLIDAASPGLFQIGVLPEGKNGFGRALLRYAGVHFAPVPLVEDRPAELDMVLLDYADLRGIFPPKVPAGSRVTRTFNMTLRQTDIDVEGLNRDDPLVVSADDIVRFNIRNESANWHPIHLHGHHFHFANAGRPLKDTAIIRSRDGEMSWEWRADNPGKWMMHCHNLYHHKDGMMRNIIYEDFLGSFRGLPDWMSIDSLCN